MVINESSVYGVILAAGSSKRMETPKALLNWCGKSLIDYQVDSLLTGGCNRVWVVTGKHHKEIVSNITVSEKVKIVFNVDHYLGKSTSVKKGVRSLPKDLFAMVLIAVDQPRPPWIISKLINEHKNKTPLITSPTFLDRGGHPLIFNSQLIPELKEISESSFGIRKVFTNHKSEILSVPFDSKIVRLDINTPEDYSEALDQYGL